MATYAVEVTVSTSVVVTVEADNLYDLENNGYDLVDAVLAKALVEQVESGEAFLDYVVDSAQEVQA
jgi:hypothetical protein